MAPPRLTGTLPRAFALAFALTFAFAFAFAFGGIFTFCGDPHASRSVLWQSVCIPSTSSLSSPGFYRPRNPLRLPNLDLFLNCFLAGKGAQVDDLKHVEVQL